MDNKEKSDRAAQPGDAAPRDPQDMQIDEATGRPVGIVPDGEKPEESSDVSPDERLRVDPQSRIPRPVQPDLA